MSYYYTGNIKSVLNTIGFEYDLDANAPIGNGGYGDNQDGTGSRLTQLNAMGFVARRNPVFGLGSEAQVREEIRYYWYGKSAVLKSYDMGIIQTFCDEGLIGILAMISLIIHMFTSSKRNIYYRLSLYAFLLSTLSTSNMLDFCFVNIIIFNALENRKKE